MPEKKPVRAANVPSPTVPPPSLGNAPQQAAPGGRKDASRLEKDAEAQARHESRPVAGTGDQTKPGKLRNQ